MRKIANASKITREEWLEIRKKYIGGSDAGAIAGVNPWASAASVWADKISDDVEDIDNERMRIGRDLEDYVAKRFAEATGKKVRRNNHMMVSDRWPWMLANIDRELVGEKAILECKTTGSYSKSDWEDGQIPPQYYAQVQHYMAVLEYEKAYIACLIGNEKFVWYEIPRDQEYLDALIELERAFYERCMIGGGYPDADGSTAFSEAIKKRYRQAVEPEITVDELEGTAEQYLTIQAEIKELETLQRKLQQEMQLVVADYELAAAGARTISWKNVTSNRFDTKGLAADYPEIAEQYYKTSESRRFTVK